jgi:hypothetical protein
MHTLGKLYFVLLVISVSLPVPMDRDRWLQSPDAVAKRKSCVSLGIQSPSISPQPLNVMTGLDTSVHGTGTWSFWIEKVDIRYVYTNSYTHTVNNNVSMNSNQHHTSQNIHINIFIAAIIYFRHWISEGNASVLYNPLYSRLPEDGNLSLRHVGGFLLVDSS